jgi:hypothetical protein
VQSGAVDDESQDRQVDEQAGQVQEEEQRVLAVGGATLAAAPGPVPVADISDDRGDDS